MVKVTDDLILRCASGHTKKFRKESMLSYVKRLTHLFLEDKGLDDVGDALILCENLVVLYLYDNNLTKIPKLPKVTILTHLYLQNNRIRELDGIGAFRRLTKLYLGGNNISYVGGLTNLICLQELHVENQKLEDGKRIIFEPESIQTISASLKVLNVSGNRLTSLVDFECLSELEQIHASNNDLSDLDEMIQTFTFWHLIKQVELSNNPVTQTPKYRDQVIMQLPLLESLDGRTVTNTEKLFLKNWKTMQHLSMKQKISKRLTTIDFGDELQAAYVE